VPLFNQQRTTQNTFEVLTRITPTQSLAPRPHVVEPDQINPLASTMFRHLEQVQNARQRRSSGRPNRCRLLRYKNPRRKRLASIGMGDYLTRFASISVPPSCQINSVARPLPSVTKVI
jgi:hypothetical protein